MNKNFFQATFQPLWYDEKSDSTLHRYDWRAKHWAFAIIASLILQRHFEPFIAIAFVDLIFIGYKFFYQKSYKREKAIKDFIADFCDYQFAWLTMPMPSNNTFYTVLLGLMVIHILTSKWSTP